MSPFRILSLDGGGIRGWLTASLLQRLQNDLKQQGYPDFLEKVDLFAGTSTGGLLALGLAKGLSLQDCRDLYEKHGPIIFKRPRFGVLSQILRAKYKNDYLGTTLREYFGDDTLGDLAEKRGKRVLVCTFDLDNGPNNRQGVRMWKAKFYHNFDPADSDYKEKMVDVALRTSAAPTYFPIYDGHVDGGVVANNPSTCALAQALDPQTGKQTLNDIALLSLGTGLNPKIVEQQNASWGLAQWAWFRVTTFLGASPSGGRALITDLLVEGTGDVAHYQCRQILTPRFHRLNPQLDQPLDLDAIDKFDVLRTAGEKALLEDAKTQEPTVAWMKAHFFGSQAAA